MHHANGWSHARTRSRSGGSRRDKRRKRRLAAQVSSFDQLGTGRLDESAPGPTRSATAIRPSVGGRLHAELLPYNRAHTGSCRRRSRSPLDRRDGRLELAPRFPSTSSFPQPARGGERVRLLRDGAKALDQPFAPPTVCSRAAVDSLRPQRVGCGSAATPSLSRPPRPFACPSRKKFARKLPVTESGRMFTQ